MSQEGLEVLDSTLQKTHEWINATAEAAHIDPPTAFKALRAVLHTLRDRLPVDVAAHFSAQLPMLLRGLYFDGWRPSEVPVKLTQSEFLHSISRAVMTAESVDPVRLARAVFSVVNHHFSSGEVEKIRAVLPREIQLLWPEPLAVLV